MFGIVEKRSIVHAIIDYGQMLLTFLCGIHTFLLMIFPMINFALATILDSIFIPIEK